jgi:hypothetical protein
METIYKELLEAMDKEFLVVFCWFRDFIRIRAF